MAKAGMVSPRKGMAMGMKDGAFPKGNFGVKNYAEEHGSPSSEDRGMKHEAMDDDERGISGSHISRGKGMHPGQAYPDHGPHRARKY